MVSTCGGVEGCPGRELQQQQQWPFSDDDVDAASIPLTQPPNTTQSHTGNAYLPEDKEKDEDEEKGVELAYGKPVAWCGQNGKCT